jgi:cell division protein FtsI (penicillin-binding protein 3)
VAVTAVQSVAAFSCVANDGQWIQPYLVSRVTSSYGDTLEEHQGESRRVLSASTAATLRSMLEDVVVKGTGKRAQVGGYRAAGKTGTAQKVDPATGHYSNTRYVASFAGFAPVDHPEIACIVSIDEPVGAHHGGDVAAPVFARVIADTLHVLGIPPDGPSDGALVAGEQRVYELPSKAFDTVSGEPTAESSDTRPSLEVAARTAGGSDASKLRGSVVVPDLNGLGIRSAVAMCTPRGLRLKAEGDGLIISQSPQPGTLVAQDSICQVKLSSQPRRLRLETSIGFAAVGPGPPRSMAARSIEAH